MLTCCVSVFNYSSCINKKPAVCIDVDGVLRIGNRSVSGATEALKKLRDNNVPLAIITNGGGETEKIRAEKISSLLKLQGQLYSIKPNEVVLCHSPMKDALKKYSEQNRLILILGTGSIKNVMKEYGYSNYITSNEYAILFPQLLPFFFFYGKPPLNLLYDKTKMEVEERIKKSIKRLLKIDAICQLTDVINWDINMQILCDLLISNDGIPGSIRSTGEEQKVDYHLACQDILFQDLFPIPRFACGSFFYCLQRIFELKYKRKVNFVDYGKPSKIIFNYAKKEIEKANPGHQYNYYMIGDNPEVDIKGANDSGFHSILVKTGIFKGRNSKEFPAKTVVNDIKDAIDFILHRELKV